MRPGIRVVLVGAMMLAGMASGRAAWFGADDRGAIRAGARVFQAQCARCHAVGFATRRAAAMSLYEARYPDGARRVYELLRGRMARPAVHPVLQPVAARDVAVYLGWLADPTRDRRRRLGMAAIGFLIAFGAVGYFAFGTRTG